MGFQARPVGRLGRAGRVTCRRVGPGHISSCAEREGLFHRLFLPALDLDGRWVETSVARRPRRTYYVDTSMPFGPVYSSDGGILRRFRLVVGLFSKG